MPTTTPAVGPEQVDTSIAYITGRTGERVAGAGSGWDPLPLGRGSEVTLERLVYASLFTDARLPDSLSPRDGTDDRRGWWADGLEAAGRNEGSLLWYVLQTIPTARALEDTIKDALAWMVTDGLCTRVDVVAGVSRTRADVRVDLVLESGDRVPVQFPNLWSAYGA